MFISYFLIDTVFSRLYVDSSVISSGSAYTFVLPLSSAFLMFPVRGVLLNQGGGILKGVLGFIIKWGDLPSTE